MENLPACTHDVNKDYDLLITNHELCGPASIEYLHQGKVIQAYVENMSCAAYVDCGSFRDYTQPGNPYNPVGRPSQIFDDNLETNDDFISNVDIHCALPPENRVFWNGNVNTIHFVWDIPEPFDDYPIFYEHPDYDPDVWYTIPTWSPFDGYTIGGGQCRQLYSPADVPAVLALYAHFDYEVTFRIVTPKVIGGGLTNLIALFLLGAFMFTRDPFTKR